MWQKYLLTIKIPHKEENKWRPNSQKFQETGPPFSLPFGTWHFTCANCQKVCAPFCWRISSFVNKSLLCFEEGRNSVTVFIGEIRSNPDRAGSFKRLIEVLKPTKFVTATNKTHCYPFRPTDFLPPRFWVESGWSLDNAQPVSSFQRPREAEEREPGKEVES